MRLAACFLVACVLLHAQVSEPPSSAQDKGSAPLAADSAVPAGLADLMKSQFGSGFEIAWKKHGGTGFKYRIEEKVTWTPFLTGDFDGDGVEDAAIVARSKQPMAGEGEYHYKVIDPYFTAYGYGDPKITATLASEDPDNRGLLLVIHGSGTEAWRATSPKSKFVMVNLPIENIAARKTMFKKHLVAAIDPQSAESNGAVVIWDGKKYRWVEGIGK